MWCGVRAADCPPVRRLDYLHVTRRFGLVAAAQLPFHYLLGVKSPYSPVQLITGRSHEQLNSVHRLWGRIILALLYCHAALYLNFYVQTGLLAVKLSQFDVLCGMCGIFALTVLGCTALSPVRRRSYRVFYVAHMAVATALPLVLFFHTTHVRIFVYQTALVHCINVALRGWNSCTVRGKLRAIPGTSLLEITVPLDKGTGTSGLRGFEAGQHAYVAWAGKSVSRTFRSNPFSVASVPTIDHELRFVVRVLDGNTARFARETPRSAAAKFTIEGPYGVSTHGEELLKCNKTVFVAGGVGATFVVPLYQQLLADLSPSKGSFRRANVSFVWVARSLADVTWALPSDQTERNGFEERLRLYLTRPGADVPTGTETGFATSIEEWTPDVANEPGHGLEMEEQKSLLPDNGGAAAGGLKFSAGRPDLQRVTDQAFGHGPTEKVGVVVCGPLGLRREMREHVGRWVGRSREVWYWEEAFAL